MIEEKVALKNDMGSEEFQEYGQRILHWIGDYLADGYNVVPVLAQVLPGDITKKLPSSAPLVGRSMSSILSDFEQVVMPGVTHWNSPGFMGYFGVTVSGPDILLSILGLALNQTRILWRTSPAAAELEQVTLSWLRQMLHLPPTLFGMIQSNSAVRLALAMARERKFPVRLFGAAEGPRLRVYASQEAHVSVDKACILLGFGEEGLRKIKTDGAYRMDTDTLERAILEDLEEGWIPCAVVATVGTTSSTSIDPVPDIATLCKKYDLWLHVDAAYAGCAAILPEYQWVLDGCNHADSISLNPHKWLGVHLNCSVFYTQQPKLLKQVFAVSHGYLETPESIAPPDLSDYTDTLPHGFPALSLWAVLSYFGVEGLQSRLQEHCRLAGLFRSYIEGAHDFEVLAPTPLSVVCFRVHPRGINDTAFLNILNTSVMNAVNAEGTYFLSHTFLDGAFVMRCAIGNIRTSEREIDGLWNVLLKNVQRHLSLYAERSE